MAQTEFIHHTTTGIPIVALKPVASPLQQFFRERFQGDAGSVNIVEVFGAIGGLAGALIALRRSLTGESTEVGPAPSATLASPTPTTPASEPGIDPALETEQVIEAVAGRGKLKYYATAGAIVVGGHVGGLAVGNKVSDVRHSLHRVVPDVVCVSSPPPDTNAPGYLRIGDADVQTPETILPLQAGQSCASPTVELSMHLETTLNPPDGACVDVRLGGEPVRSYVTLDIKNPSVDLRLREGTTCEPSKNTLVTVRRLEHDNGLGR